MNQKVEKQIINITPGLIRLIAKAVRLSRGGLTKAERRELAYDLLELSGKVLEGIDKE